MGSLQQFIMAEGCVPNFVKYTLFLTNFIVFILGIVTLGFGIWILVDKPSFLDLFSNAEDVLNENNIDTNGFDLGVYAGAPIILIVIAVIVSLIAFFGCFGALRESKCLLITYFVILLAIFIGAIVGAVLIFQGDFESEIKKPLVDSIKYYKDTPDSGDAQGIAFKNVWNTVQDELRCCGVNNATDWSVITFEDGMNKPEGCCKYTRNQDEENNPDQVKACRIAPYSSTDKYYYQGCYTVFVEEIENQQDKIFAAAITTTVVMFLNMLFSFALCTMAD